MCSHVAFLPILLLEEQRLKASENFCCSGKADNCPDWAGAKDPGRAVAILVTGDIKGKTGTNGVIRHPERVTQAIRGRSERWAAGCESYDVIAFYSALLATRTLAQRQSSWRGQEDKNGPQMIGPHGTKKKKREKERK